MKLDRDGFALDYEVEGGAGRWITFSNSLVCDRGMWDALAPLLAGRYRLLRYDTRGHGRSDAPVPPYDLSGLGDDIVALWDHLGIDRSHVVGLSLGGTTGIGLALRHQARLLSLTAADCRASADDAYAGIFLRRIETARASGLEALVEPTLQRFFTPAFAGQRPDVVERYGAMIRGTSAAGHEGCCAALAGARLQDDLPRIAVPTLFIGGEHDIGAPPGEMAAMHRATPGSTHVVLAGAGHISCEERPGAFHDALAAHLAAAENRHPARTH